MWEHEGKSAVGKKHYAAGLVMVGALVMCITLFVHSGRSPSKALPAVDVGKGMPSSSQSATTDELRQEYSEVSEQLIRLGAKYPRVTIQGRIVDRDPGFIQVWGTATPIDARPNAFGVLYEDSNILVYHPDEESIHSGYYIGGAHYFLEKRYENNQFGQPVPLWVYGDEPDELKDAQDHSEGLVRQLNARSAESAPTRWKVISKIFASAPTLTSDAERSSRIEELNDALRPLGSFGGVTLGSTPSFSPLFHRSYGFSRGFEALRVLVAGHHRVSLPR